MKTLQVDLENCYGIKKLKYEFDFSNRNAYAIYAPNGSMKTSLAQVFKDISFGVESKDRIFPSRLCCRRIVDEHGSELPKESVLVLSPYDETFSHSEKTSTLLVDSNLRQEYEELQDEIDKSKDLLLKALKELSGSKKNIEKEISSAFCDNENEFYHALIGVKEGVLSHKVSQFADIRYDVIFDEKVLNFLETKDIKAALESYIKKYNELLANSTYFKRGTFDYHNGSTIAKNLADNGFFTAKHSIKLNAAESLEITSQNQLNELIEKEKEGISTDKELRKKFESIEKLITKNMNLRDFAAYIQEHEELLPFLTNIDNFKKEIWRSYFFAEIELYNDLINKFDAAEKRKKEIEEEAGKQRTQWEKVIEIFNNRFFVPFKLIATNRTRVILGGEQKINLGFIYEDGENEVSIEKETLLQALSTGEKKAFYILNIIFEVEVRKKATQETLFVIDDIADSFDYKNKYAIIQYLMEIAKEPYFKQIILTHNFDFFRTINSRYIGYSYCLMAVKNDIGVSLEIAVGIRNIFVNDWKINFFKDPQKRIASIPFICNIIEYTRGENDPFYNKLTSLLHWKSDTENITQDDLDCIYNSVFGTSETYGAGRSFVIDDICLEANNCLKAAESINFENKIVLSIAIRIIAEKYMINKINNRKLVENIGNDQTSKLLVRVIDSGICTYSQIEILQRVILMTPANIHLNSFMYEPIMDMSDQHLRTLYSDVLTLK